MSWEWLPPVLVGALLPFLFPWGKQIHSWCRRPVLELYKPEKDEEAYVEIGLQDEEGRGRFVAIKVRNTGKTSAQGCYVNLMKLEQQLEPGEWREHIGIRDPEALPWANRGFERGYSQQTIEHDAPLTISLCLTRQTQPKKVQFQIRGAEYINGHPVADGRQRDFEEGKYRATLRVYSSNAKPDTRCIEVTKGATWQDLTIRQVDCERLPSVL